MSAKYKGEVVTCNLVLSPEGETCPNAAEWTVAWGEHWTEDNHSCSEHIADFLNKEHGSGVYPIEFDIHMDQEES